MTYTEINGTLAGNDIMYVFLKANEYTHGMFIPFLILSFFLTVFISSLIMQLRFSNTVKLEMSCLASSFATFGFCIILSQRNGLLEPSFFWITAGATVLSLIWVVFSNE